MAVSTVYDYVAFAGQRKYTILPAGMTRREFTDEIIDTAVAGGWELISYTEDTNGPGGIIASQQAPWYSDDVPDWYIENRIGIEINNDASQDVALHVGQYIGGGVVNKTPSSWGYRWSEITPYAVRYLANPYQLTFWSDNPSIAGNPNRYRGFIAAAVNTPKFMYQRLAIVNNLWANRNPRSLNDQLVMLQQTYSYMTTRSSTPAAIEHNNNTKFLTLQSAVSEGDVTGTRVWNQTLDPTMLDYKKWSPFFIPARMIYRTGLSPSTDVINSFLWDALIIQGSFTENTTLNIGDKTWIVYSGNTTGTTTLNEGVLCLCIDEILPE